MNLDLTTLPFPKGPALDQFLNLSHASDLEDLLDRSLNEPLNDFFLRPRKNLRNQIVQLGFSLAAKHAGISKNEWESLCDSCCAVLEIFHAGSLVVDDIQDDSEYRRGGKTLHRIYGLPLALNAGNWLYFLPFTYIEQLPLSVETKAALVRACNETLLRAHYGQALDLGVPVDTLSQERVRDVSFSAMELKSGVLTGLAFKMGAVALGCNDETVQRLDSFGRKLGVALQMMDDIGCLTSKHNPLKKCEDLKHKRLGFIFAVASEGLAPKEYLQLRELLNSSQQNLEEILNFLANHHIPETAKASAEKYLAETIAELKSSFAFLPEEEQVIDNIQTYLVNAYE